MEHPITHDTFGDWLDRYGRAWMSERPEAAAPLFTTDAEYHWTPLEAPQRGRSEIVAAWGQAIERQRDIRFRYEILSVEGATGVAHWRTSLVRRDSGEAIEVDGVLVADFDGDGLCCRFREWWHSSESGECAR
ncbi:nuclear transport factor 2 family protein [Halomonas denitrificans]|nr:nuclear transport factor 2 family protein [Halomonas denitrificans]